MPEENSETHEADRSGREDEGYRPPPPPPDSEGEAIRGYRPPPPPPAEEGSEQAAQDD